jgi:hypothetical protein
VPLVDWNNTAEAVGRETEPRLKFELKIRFAIPVHIALE